MRILTFPRSAAGTPLVSPPVPHDRGALDAYKTRLQRRRSSRMAKTTSSPSSASATRASTPTMPSARSPMRRASTLSTISTVWLGGRTLTSSSPFTSPSGQTSRWILSNSGTHSSNSSAPQSMRVSRTSWRRLTGKAGSTPRACPQSQSSTRPSPMCAMPWPRSGRRATFHRVPRTFRRGLATRFSCSSRQCWALRRP